MTDADQRPSDHDDPDALPHDRVLPGRAAELAADIGDPDPAAVAWGKAIRTAKEREES